MALPVNRIMGLFDPAVLGEAASRFGLAPEGLRDLEGSSFVYAGEGPRGPAVLKISPGYLPGGGVGILGSTEAQVLGELEFVDYLARRGVAVARPLESRQGRLVETIPVGDAECFLVDCFEKLEGYMYPDEDEVDFPEAVLAAWGRTAGRMHRLAAGYSPSSPERRRPSWEADDLLDAAALIPPGQTALRERYAELVAELRALPQGEECYGLVHGDLHHGNFFVFEGELRVFDFDACRYSWFMAEICLALDNCLPPPRYGPGRRRTYALRFLEGILRGYREEAKIEGEWIRRVPLFMRYADVLRQSYRWKYWDMTSLSSSRAEALDWLRSRIEEGRPALELSAEDLASLAG